MGRQTKAEVPMFCGCEFSKVEVDGWTAKHIALVAERFDTLYHTFLLVRSLKFVFSGFHAPLFSQLFMGFGSFMLFSRLFSASTISC